MLDPDLVLELEATALLQYAGSPEHKRACRASLADFLASADGQDTTAAERKALAEALVFGVPTARTWRMLLAKVRRDVELSGRRPGSAAA